MSKEISKKTQGKKCFIVGFAPSWQHTPWTDENAEVWGLNELYQFLKTVPTARADRWFEIHNPQSPSKNNKTHHEWLQQCPIPIYMQKHYEEFPNSIPYPREEIKEFFNTNFLADGIGAKFTDYSNQISWMTALAIYETYQARQRGEEGFSEIHIYGVDMAQKSEYAWQRASCQFFIGFAAGMGIKILIPQNSELCKFPQDYGFDTDNQTRIFKRDRKKRLGQEKQQLLNEIAKAKNAIGQMQARVNILDGAMGEIDYDLSNHII